MRYYNFFKDKTIFLLFSIFIVLSIIHIIIATLINRGLTADGFIWATDILNQFHHKGYGFAFVERTRLFTQFIEQLPINIAYWVGIKQKNILLYFFSLPLFLFPFLVNLYNIILAKRTKRYDIVLYSLIAYGLLILPCIMYATVEACLAVSLLLLLIHYFIANINYKIKDIIIISILLIFSFNSSEIVIFTGPILFFISLFYTKENIQLKQKIIKFYIGFTSICASAYVAYMNIYIINSGERKSTFWQEIFNYSNNIIEFFIKEPYIIQYLTFFLILVYAIKSQKINKKQTNILISLYLLLVAYIFFNKETYIYIPYFVKYRIYIYIFFPILTLIIFFQEYYKKYINKQSLYNIYIVVLTASISNTLIQFYYSYETIQLQNEYKRCIEKTNDIFIIPDKTLMSVYNAPQ